MSLARVYIANSIPSYFTEGAWDELDWLEIDGVTSLGAVGRAPKSASFRPVDAPAMMHYETAPAQHELVIECQDQRGPVNDRLNASVLSRQEHAVRIVHEPVDSCHGFGGAELIEHLIGPVIAYRSGAAEAETAAKRMIRVAINAVFDTTQTEPIGVAKLTAYAVSGVTRSAVDVEHHNAYAVIAPNIDWSEIRKLTAYAVIEGE